MPHVMCAEVDHLLVDRPIVDWLEGTSAVTLEDALPSAADMAYAGNSTDPTGVEPWPALAQHPEDA
jgi:hypothetical protein